MDSSRRVFIQRSIAASVAGSALAWSSSQAAQADLLKGMSWLNPPESTRQAGSQLIVRSRAKTDFWRKTFYGYITDNGHFLHLPVEGDFTFQARVNGRYAAQYDQAGLMVRLNEQEWMKCGSELVDGRRWASVVFTHDFSDWSTLPDLSQSDPVWWRAVRRKDSLEAQCSIDGEKFMTVRQGYFKPGVSAAVGIMCAAPEGSGFEAVFDELSLQRHS